MQRNILFGQTQMKTLGIMSHDGIYTNLGLLLSDQCVHTIKIAVFEGTTQNEFKDRKEFSGSLFCQMNEVYNYIDFRNQTHKRLQVSQTTCGRLLKQMVENGQIIQEGKGRNTHYYLAD